MTDQTASAARAPWRAHVPRYVPFLNTFARPLLRAGTPMGPNALVTIRGRRSGLPRTTPLAIVEHSGRRWIWAPFGDVDWVRNLRAAGVATITSGPRTEAVAATELDPAQREAFFRDVLVPVARSMPLGVWLMRTLLRTDLDDPVAASEIRPVFELHPGP
jgi:deazaflavin-dependent oxidoreductase (nitroreductase family)